MTSSPFFAVLAAQVVDLLLAARAEMNGDSVAVVIGGTPIAGW